MNTTLLYPPVLPSTKIPFINNSLDIIFELSTLNALSSISGIELFVYLQTTNSEITRIKINKENFIQLNKNQFQVNLFLPGTIEDGNIYKIQGRFYAIQNKTEYIYSEMSSVLITKKISISKLPQISNIGNNNINTILTEKVEFETNPQIIGSCEFTPASMEYVDTFRMILQYKFYDKEYITIEDSGEQRHNANAESADIWRFNTQLEDYNNNMSGPKYRVIYSVKSNNGYEPSGASYEFIKSSRVGWNFDSAPETPYFAVEVNIDEENGKNLLYLKNKHTEPTSLHRNLVISRCDDSNSKKREDITYFPISHTFAPGERMLIFTDYLIECGVPYKYYVQWENQYGIRSKAISHIEPVINNFEYVYLYNKNRQLKLKFDNTLSSFKRITLAAKQDTLGSKYPTILKNGQTSYYEFSIGGLLSFLLNDKDEFLKPYYDATTGEYLGYEYNGQLIISKDKLSVYKELSRNSTKQNQIDDEKYQIDTSLTANNIFVEKIFRDKVIEFLNEEQAFLYKSPTEGNMIISVLDVSLEPKQELGRQIFSFNTQAYQIADTSIENYIKYDIFNKTSYTDLSNLNPTLIFGQISGFFKSKSNQEAGDNLLTKIQEKEDLTEDNYYYRIQTDDMLLSIEAHDTDLTLLKQKKFALIYQLNKKLQEENDDLQSEETKLQTEELKAQIEELSAAEAYLESIYYNTGMQISINDIIYYIPFGKTFTYHATKENPITSIYLISDFIEASKDMLLPININYICSRKTYENQKENSVISQEVSYLFGQVSGLCLAEKSGTDRFNQPLLHYNPFFKEFKTWRIYSDLPSLNNGQIDMNNLLQRTNNNGLDNTEYKVYKSTELYSIIAQEAKDYVELLYHLADEDKLVKQNSNNIWSNEAKNKKYILSCKFSGINSIIIESIPGIRFNIQYTSLKEDGSNTIQTQTYIMNPTGRLKIQVDQNSYISDIKLLDNAYVTINYKCETTQQTSFNELSGVEYDDK